MNTAFLRRLGAAAVAVIAAIAVLTLALTGFAEPVSAAAGPAAGVAPR